MEKLFCYFRENKGTIICEYNNGVLGDIQIKLRQGSNVKLNKNELTGFAEVWAPLFKHPDIIKKGSQQLFGNIDQSLYCSLIDFITQFFYNLSNSNETYIKKFNELLCKSILMQPISSICAIKVYFLLFYFN